MATAAVRSNVRIHKKTGWVPDIPDARDYEYRKFFKATAYKPTLVSQRVNMSLVEDQKDIGSCTANALLAEGERQMKLKGTSFNGSRLYLYYKERERRGWENSDTGAYIRDGIWALDKFGVPEEKKWPYITKNFAKKPTTAIDKLALDHTIDGYYRLDKGKPEQIDDALVRGFTVTFGIPLYSSWWEIGKNGLYAGPGVNETQEGGHAIQIIGYDKTKKRASYDLFEIRNSWGRTWGDKGHAWCNRKYITEQAEDIWVYELMTAAQKLAKKNEKIAKLRKHVASVKRSKAA